MPSKTVDSELKLIKKDKGKFPAKANLWRAVTFSVLALRRSKLKDSQLYTGHWSVIC